MQAWTARQCLHGCMHSSLPGLTVRCSPPTCCSDTRHSGKGPRDGWDRCHMCTRLLIARVHWACSGRFRAVTSCWCAIIPGAQGMTHEVNAQGGSRNHLSAAQSYTLEAFLCRRRCTSAAAAARPGRCRIRCAAAHANTARPRGEPACDAWCCLTGCHARWRARGGARGTARRAGAPARFSGLVPAAEPGGGAAAAARRCARAHPHLVRRYPCPVNLFYLRLVAVAPVPNASKLHAWAMR